ncbi:MAG: GHKL domain-containing protein [Clostridia bacterium]|nr:GHKL domain-containing protein [Clostridia bacterium]
MKNKKGKLNKFKYKFYVPLFIFPVLTVINNFLLFVSNINGIPEAFEDKYSSLTYVLSVVSVIACCYIFVYYQELLERENKIKDFETQKKIESIDKTYFEILEKNNEDLKLFTHDIKNHLMHISSLSESEEVKKYVDDLCGTVTSFGSKIISKNKTLDIIINKYSVLCESKKIKLNFDTKTENLSFVEPTDLSTILNNLLDNAIEASGNSEEKFINVKISLNEHNMKVLTIINSCDKEPVTSNGKLVTTKENTSGHGLGIKSVKRTLKNYNGDFEWFYDKEKKEFKVIVLFS